MTNCSGINKIIYHNCSRYYLERKHYTVLKFDANNSSCFEKRGSTF